MSLKRKSLYFMGIFVLLIGVVAASSAVHWFGSRQRAEETAIEVAEKLFQAHALEAWDKQMRRVVVKSPPARIKSARQASRVQKQVARAKRNLVSSPVSTSQKPPLITPETDLRQRSDWREQLIEALGYEERAGFLAISYYQREREDQGDELWQEVSECLFGQSILPDPQRALVLLDQIELLGFQNTALIAFYRGTAFFMDAQRQNPVTERMTQTKSLEQSIAWLAEANSRKLEFYKSRVQGQVSPERFILTIPLLQGLAYHSLYLDGLGKDYYRFNARNQLMKYLSFAQEMPEPPKNLASVSHLLENSF